MDDMNKMRRREARGREKERDARTSCLTCRLRCSYSSAAADTGTDADDAGTGDDVDPDEEKRRPIRVPIRPTGDCLRVAADPDADADADEDTDEDGLRDDRFRRPAPPILAFVRTAARFLARALLISFSAAAAR